MKNSQIFVGTPENVNAQLQKFEEIQNARGGLVSWEVSPPSLTVHNDIHEMMVAVTVSWTTDLSKTVDDRIRV